jgi:S-(hydroxymethyl)glutathione dehydrogenase / alcohol dehydrogenase
LPTLKAAVLFENNKPLKITNLRYQKLQKGQVLVKILYSGFCSSQYGEITGVKGKDKYLPHCLGHEACGVVKKIGSNVSNIKPNDLVVLHWMKSIGRDCKKIEFKEKSSNLTINSGNVTTFSNYTIVSSNRLTKITKNKYKKNILPLLGCSVSVAISTLEKILKIRKNKNILILGSGALGLPMIHYAKYLGLKNVDVLDKNEKSLKKAKKFGAGFIFKSIFDSKLKQKFNKNFYDYIADTTASSFILNNILDYPISCKIAFVGVPKLNEKIQLNSLRINYGLKLLGSYGGNFDPKKDISRYLDFLLKSRFNFKEYISKTYKFEQINKLISDYKNGKIIGKALIKF